MAGFNKINGKEIKDVTFQELQYFFKQHCFLKFLEAGIPGLKLAVQDLLVNLEMFLASNDLNRGNMPKTLDAQGMAEMEAYAMEELLNGFITKGTNSFDAVIIHINMVMAQKRKPVIQPA